MIEANSDDLPFYLSGNKYCTTTRLGNDFYASEVYAAQHGIDETENQNRYGK